MHIFAFVKKEIVFFTAFAAAVISAFFVPPSAEYLHYIDTDTIFILFALMGVVGALRAMGIFDRLGIFLTQKFSSLRSLCTVLVLLCFFLSMLLTNDVALLTFVPFSLALLLPVTSGKITAYTVILQTMAANLGSMLTPLGNPQNLFLFQNMGTDIASFIMILLPYTLFSLVLIIISLLFIPSVKINLPQSQGVPVNGDLFKKILYGLLFVTCIFSVLRIVPKPLAALLVLAALIVFDRKVLRSVDYMLLLTFCAFFVFTGNIARINGIKEFLASCLTGNDFSFALAASQIISNVPAALLLFPFSSNTGELLTGVNIGGLGTLIASLASLISYKLYSRSDSSFTPLKYLLFFTVMNIIYLAALLGFRLFYNSYLL